MLKTAALAMVGALFLLIVMLWIVGPKIRSSLRFTVTETITIPLQPGTEIQSENSFYAMGHYQIGDIAGFDMDESKYIMQTDNGVSVVVDFDRLLINYYSASRVLSFTDGQLLEPAQPQFLFAYFIPYDDVMLCGPLHFQVLDGFAPEAEADGSIQLTFINDVVEQCKTNHNLAS